ncbi:MAG TPA: neutral zinc metallopeptidase [Vicinamibacterales bacterium]|nr:neutral zinc metallopeptidase [Vicinamibacterales bacterium]
MRWQGRQGSSNIEDRRGMGIGLPVGGGIGGLVLLLLFSALTGTNPLDLISSSAPDSGAVGTNAVRDDDPQAQFVSVVLKDTEDTWGEIMRQHGDAYRPPTLVLFTDATETSCGVGQSAMGPFYCPNDQKVYLDLSFFRDLDQRFGAPGDFAQAYVVAHEVGHHIQTLRGLTQQVDAARQRSGQSQSNALSVRVELQADCYAGVWGHYAASRGLLEPGDAEEGLRAAAAIGDDRLQQQTQGRVVPESFTHGTSQERVQWLRRGLDSGRVETCNTFGTNETF